MLVMALRTAVYEANMALQQYGLVTFTWGNVSGIDRELGLVVIKPSGVAYADLSPENMVVLNLSGDVLEGGLKPSSDTATHLVLYQNCPAIGGVVHTHSAAATAWAQAGAAIPALGTTHADYFFGDIPCARALTDAEIATDYERNTGLVMLEHLTVDDVLAIPGMLVREHAPFAWGETPKNAVHNAVVIEEVAKMAVNTLLINPNVRRINQALLNKHYLRKHGKNAYYGQTSSKPSEK